LASLLLSLACAGCASSDDPPGDLSAGENVTIRNDTTQIVDVQSERIFGTWNDDGVVNPGSSRVFWYDSFHDGFEIRVYGQAGALDADERISDGLVIVIQ
jgi:hypothetical protein